MASEDFERGTAMRRKVMGDEYVNRSHAAADPEFDAPFQEFVTEVAWGRVWGQSSLPPRQLSLQVVAILATLGRDAELEMHFRGALRNGCTVAELRDTLKQVAIYAGFPAALTAFRIGRAILEEEKTKKAKAGS